MNHIGIYLSNNTNKALLLEEITSNTFLREYSDLTGWHGLLFSTIIIDQMIDEEIRHDKVLIKTNENDGLMSMSSGQRRRALIEYIIGQKPDYIILDDIFGSVDLNTQQYILECLEPIAGSTLLIQLFYRKQDVLKNICMVVSVNDEGRIVEHQSLQQFQAAHNTIPHGFDLALPFLFNENQPEMSPLIRLNSVSASYGDKHVLHNISWTIEPGEFWQLMGPIGSGKSTILSMIIGDNARGYGEDITLFGRKKGSGETIWDIKKKIGYFYPTMTFLFTHDDTVENMIISGLVDSVGLYKKPTGLQKNVADAWLHILGPSFKDKRFSQLSPGQQRIVLVVRAMVKQPPLLILDEPIVGLDDHNAQLFIDLISAIAAQHKMAIIYVSHRNEPMLKPDKILELIPTPDGSVAQLR